MNGIKPALFTERFPLPNEEQITQLETRKLREESPDVIVQRGGERAAEFTLEVGGGGAGWADVRRRGGVIGESEARTILPRPGREEAEAHAPTHNLPRR